MIGYIGDSTSIYKVFNDREFVATSDVRFEETTFPGVKVLDDRPYTRFKRVPDQTSAPDVGIYGSYDYKKLLEVIPVGQETEPSIVDVDDAVLTRNDATNKGLPLEPIGGRLPDSRSTQTERQPLPPDKSTQSSTSAANGQEENAPQFEQRSNSNTKNTVTVSKSRRLRDRIQSNSRSVL